MTSSTLDPQLAPPGAGLPRIELAIARALFRWKSFTVSRAGATAAIAAGRERVGAFARRLEIGDGSRRVLIDRLPGLEDSSRYWSIYMTVAHLRIVNGGIADTMRRLLAGEAPVRRVSTAAVKPDPAADESEIARFEESCDALLALARRPESLKTRLRHAHPWFGELDAWDWYVLAGTHLALHRQQMGRIQEKLKASAAGC